MNFDFMREPDWATADPQIKQRALEIAFEDYTATEPGWMDAPSDLQADTKKIFLNDAFQFEQALAVETAPERRGFFGTMGSAAARGVVETIGQVGHALELVDREPRQADTEEGVLDTAGRGILDWTKRVQREYDFLKQDKGELLGEPGFVKRGVTEIAENIPRTLPIMAAAWGGAKLGATIATPFAVAAGPGGPAVIAAGTVLGTVAGATAGLVAFFGAGTYGEEYAFAYEELARTRPEATDEERKEVSHRLAFRSAALEVGTELPATFLALRMLGGAKVLTEPLKATLRNIMTQPRAEFAKKFGMAAAGETVGEMIAGGGQAWARQEEGLTGPTITEGVVESIIPSIGISLFFGAAAAGYNANQTRKMTSRLNSNDAAIRGKAIDTMAYRLAVNTQDKELALAWREQALQMPLEEKFDFDEKVISFAKIKAAEEYTETPQSEINDFGIQTAGNADEALATFTKALEDSPDDVLRKEIHRAEPDALTLQDLARLPEDQAQRILAADEGLFAGQQIEYTTPKSGPQRVVLIEQNEDGTWRGKDKDFSDIKVRPDRATPIPILEPGRQIEYTAKRGNIVKGTLVEPLGETAWRAKREDGSPFTALNENIRPIAAFGEILPEEREAAPEGQPGGAEQLKSQIDSLAHEAAPSSKNDKVATPDMLRAGNYDKGHIVGDIVGFPGRKISVETPRGEMRSEAKPADASERWTPGWTTEMKGGHYGYWVATDPVYAEGVKSADIDPATGKPDKVDVMIGEDPTSQKVFVIDQIDPKTKKFDEPKTLIHYPDIETARAAYLSSYEPGWKGLGAITEMTKPQFNAWLGDGKRKTESVAYGKTVPEIGQTAPAPIEWKTRKSMGMSFTTTPLENDTLVIQETPTKGKNKFVVYRKSGGPRLNIGKTATLEEAKELAETIIPRLPITATSKKEKGPLLTQGPLFTPGNIDKARAKIEELSARRSDLSDQIGIHPHIEKGPLGDEWRALKREEERISNLYGPEQWADLHRQDQAKALAERQAETRIPAPEIVQPGATSGGGEYGKRNLKVFVDENGDKTVFLDLGLGKGKEYLWSHEHGWTRGTKGGKAIDLKGHPEPTEAEINNAAWYRGKELIKDEGREPQTPSPLPEAGATPVAGIPIKTQILGPPSPAQDAVRAMLEREAKGTTKKPFEMTPEETAQEYVRRNTKVGDGSWDMSAVSNWSDNIRRTAKRLSGKKWFSTKELAPMSRAGKVRWEDTNKSLDFLREIGYGQIAWDKEGNPYHARADTPIREGLYQEGNLPWEKKAVSGYYPSLEKKAWTAPSPKTSYEYGKAAFGAGIDATPTLDAGFIAIAKKRGTYSADLKEWSRGWKDAESAAPKSIGLSPNSAKRLLALAPEARAFPAGDQNVFFRQRILQELTGLLPPKAKSGAGRIRDELAKAARITKEGKSLNEIEKEIHAWLAQVATGTVKAPAPREIAEKPKKAGGPENLVTWLISNGKVRLGEFSDKMTGLRKGKDRSREFPDVAAVSSANGKMAMDEAAMMMNSEGFAGGEWDARRLFDALTSGDARNIFTPDKADVMMDRQIRKEEAEYYAGIEEDLEEQARLDALAGEGKESIKGFSLDEIAEEEGLTESELAFAMRDADEFLGKISEPRSQWMAFRVGEKEYTVRGSELEPTPTPAGERPRKYTPEPPEGEAVPFSGHALRPPTKEHGKIISAVIDKPWEWKASDLIDLRPSERLAKLDKIWGPESDFELWEDGRGPGSRSRRHEVAIEHAADLEYAIKEGYEPDVDWILKKIQSHLKPQDYYAYEEIQKPRGIAPVSRDAGKADIGEVPEARGAGPSAVSPRPYQEILPGVSGREGLALTPTKGTVGRYPTAASRRPSAEQQSLFERKKKYFQENGSLEGFSEAETFSLVNPETEIFRGEISKQDMTPTRGMFEAEKPPVKASFAEMVTEAQRWKGAAVKADQALGDDKKARLAHSNMTTKGDLDAYLMKKYGLDSSLARDVSNQLTRDDLKPDMTAEIADFRGEPWADKVLAAKPAPGTEDAGKTPKGTQIFEPFPIYTVSEKGLTRSPRSAYNKNQGGLFDEVPTAPAGAVYPGAATRPSGGRTVPRAGGKLRTYIPPRGTLPVVKSEPIGTWESSRNRINTPEDAAVIARDNLELDANEQFVYITTDGAGNILSVSQHSIGGPASSLSAPHVAAGQILNVPGAENVWPVHNHPSGEAKLSDEDQFQVTLLRDLITDANIEVHSIVAVTPDRFSNSTYSSQPLPAKEPKIHKIDILGRKFEQIPRELDPIVGKEEFTAFGEMYLKDGGIVLVSSQNQPVAVINIDDYSKLRPIHTELLREAEKRNAIGFMVYDGNKRLSPMDFDNLISFGANSDLALITILDKAGDHHEIVKQMRIDAAQVVKRGEKKQWQMAGSGFEAVREHTPQEIALISAVDDLRANEPRKGYAPEDIAAAYEQATGWEFPYRVFVPLLEKLGTTFSFKASKIRNREGAAAVYDPDRNQIIFNEGTLERARDAVGKFEEVASHEPIHAVIMNLRKLNMPAYIELTRKLRDFHKELIPHLDKADFTTRYMFEEIANKNVTDEILNFAFTNKGFAKWLDSIPSIEGVKESKTLWGKLKDIILKAIGSVTGATKTKLDELNQIMDSVMEVGIGSLSRVPQGKVWQMSISDFVSDKELSRIPNHEKEGPFPNKYPEGTLLMDNYGENPYIYEMRYVNPADIDFSLEGLSRESVINFPSTQQYIKWAKDGMEPPPVTIVLHKVTGKYFSTNRRRVVAAQEAGMKKLPAFVEIGQYRTIVEKAIVDGENVPDNVRYDMEHPHEAFAKAGAYGNQREMVAAINPGSDWNSLPLDDTIRNHWKTKLEEQNERSRTGEGDRDNQTLDSRRKNKDDEVFLLGGLRERRIFDAQIKRSTEDGDGRRWEGVTLSPEFAATDEFKVIEQHFASLGYTAIALAEVSWGSSVNTDTKTVFFGEATGDNFAYFISHETSHILSEQGNKAVTDIKDSINTKHPNFIAWNNILGQGEDFTRDELAASIIGGWDKYRGVLPAGQNIQSARAATLAPERTFMGKPVPKAGGVKREKIKLFQSYGAEINGDKVVLYRGGDVSKKELSNLRYGDYLSANETGYDATGNEGAAGYGKNVVRFELPLSDVEVTGAGEFQYKGKSKSLEGGQKYPARIYKAYNDYFGSNFTAKEIDKETDVRQSASQALEGGHEEFDALMTQHNKAVPKYGLVAPTGRSSVQDLNQKLAEQLGEEWNNAFTAATSIPKSVQGIIDAFEATFKTRVVAVSPTEERFSAVGGQIFKGTLFVDTHATTGFLQLAGHELLHKIKKERPALYNEILLHARDGFQGIEGYQEAVARTMLPREAPLTLEDIEEELIADFTGDALADTEFLQYMAAGDASLFKRFMDVVIRWLKDVSIKLSKAGFGSSKYFTDVNSLRKRLDGVLYEFATRGETAVETGKGTFSPENPDIRFSRGPVVFAETTEPVTVRDFEENRALQPKLKVPSLAIGAEISRLLAPISTRLKHISPKLSAKVRRLDFDTGTAIEKDTEAVLPLLKKAKLMSRADAHDWDYARKNSVVPKINELVEKYHMQTEYAAVREVFDDLRNSAIDVGLDIGEIEEYWTRRVKDLKGLYAEMDREQLGVFSKALAEKAASLGIRVDQLDPDMRATLISNVILGGPTGPGGVSATKERKFLKIPPRLNQYYMHSDAALMEHIASMRTAIEKRKFFGKIPEKVAEMRRQLYVAQAKIREYQHRMNTLTGDKKETARLKRNEWIGKEKQLTAYIQQYALQRDYTDNIGAYVDELIVKGEIKPTEEADVSEILHARFHERGATGFWQLYKNFSYMDTMGSPVSALTQIGDLAWAMYEGGVFGALKQAGKAVTRTVKITREDVGVSRIAQEFADQSQLGGAVSWIFKYTGLEKIDAIGKEALLNVALEKYQKQARENPTKLSGEIEHIFGEETEDTIAALQNDVITDNVKMLVYSRLADFQPIALSEMPQGYLTAGNGRIFYMLKTFTIKQFDAFRNEGVHKLTHGDRAEKIQGLKSLIRLAMFFVLANATADELKDLLLGRTTDFSDRLVDNILRLAGSSKFITWKARTEGIGSAAAKQILPPFKFIDSATKDIYNAGDDKGLELTASIPLLGKLAYWHLGRGTTKRADLWDIRLRKYKANLADVNEDFEKAKDKQAFFKEHRKELADYKQSTMFQGRLNNFRKIVNQLKSRPEQTEAIKKRIEQLELKRIEMIKQFLERREK